MMDDHRFDLGTFEVVSGRMIASDPCYAENLWCCNMLENARNGTWHASIVYDDIAGSWLRVARLTAEHECADALVCSMEDANICVGVDSGQAGFFDAAHYRDDRVIDSCRIPSEQGDLWYGHCCQITLSRQQAGVLPFGVVSSSGYGDGGYDCQIQRDAAGYIVRAEIVFIDAETNEEDEDASDE